MKDERPIHVQVASALGWDMLRLSARIPKQELGQEWLAEPAWVGIPPERRPNIVSEPVPRYDTDWSATGPLIEKYRLQLRPWLDHWEAGYSYHQKDAPEPKYRVDVWAHQGTGATLLVAVCRLISALKEAGKL